MIFAHRLTLTGSPQQLPRVMPKYAEVRFSTPSGNAASVYLSDTPASVKTVSNRYEIAAGKEFPLKISDLSEIYADGTSADVLDMVCETDSTVSEQALQVKQPEPEEGGVKQE